MGKGWLALLKAVPWAEVAKNAPEISENAKKLWATVARKSPKQELEVRNAVTSGDQELNWLKDRLIIIEAACSKNHNELITTSELIKALADQNVLLIKSIELNRIRLLWLAAISFFTGIITVYCFATIIIS